MSSVVAAGPRDAWALGQANSGGGPGCGGDLEHWDGAAWRRVAIPRGVGLGDALTVPLAASSASDAWIFPGHLTHIGSGYAVYNSALHWNGTAWHAYSFAAKLILQAAVALGPADAWAFGVIGPRLDTVIPYAVRYDGRAWHRVRLPAAPLAVSAAGRDGLWVIGPTVATAGRAAGRQVIIAMRWNGRSWSRLAVPKIAVPARQSSFDAASVAAAGPHGFWWYYQAASQNNRAFRNGLERRWWKSASTTSGFRRSVAS